MGTIFILLIVLFVAGAILVFLGGLAIRAWAGVAVSIFSSKQEFIRSFLFMVPFVLIILAYISHTEVKGMYLIGYAGLGLFFGISISLVFKDENDFQAFGICFLSAFITYLSMASFESLRDLGLMEFTSPASYGIGVTLPKYTLNLGLIGGFAMYSFVVTLLSGVFGIIGVAGHIAGKNMQHFSRKVFKLIGANTK
ncbi:hypothetical protein [Grimontia marina]|uniref:Uncharacterized protein n=1 Tax=Grimontia marina TaxID=646534 RepID=A0A128EZC8_9GAMM|nr:hypothetical protein [Grimontia marina]CZF79913.1 hypothetical protein GMA8713_01184 [Grimontia marina]